MYKLIQISRYKYLIENDMNDKHFTLKVNFLNL